MVSDIHRGTTLPRQWPGQVQAMLALAWPLILTNFAYVALTTIDVVVLGKLGTAEIAAGGLAIALFNQLRTTGSGLLTSVSNLVAEAHSRGEHQRVRDLLVAGFFWATVCGVAFTIALLFLKHPLLWLGVDRQVVDMSLDFLLIAAPGLLPCLWMQTLRHFTTGLKYPGPLLVITLISIVLSLVLNYALVFGKFGLPALGLVGVALVTSLVFLLSFAMFLFVVLNNATLAPWLAVKGLRCSREALGAVWKLGLPIAGTYASEAGFFSALTMLIGTLGMEALAAQTVLNQIIYIVFMISAGISHAASIHISEAWGHANYPRAQRLGFIGLALGVVAMLLIAVPYLWMPEAIVALFIAPGQSGNAGTLALATSGLLIAVVLQVFDASQNIGNGILRGVGDTVGPLRISMLGYWLIGLPCAWVLGLLAGFGIHGVWLGQTIGLAATAALLVWTFAKRTSGPKGKR
ncbi:MATE family efflux transporter [Pseudomonas sp. CrR25]|nr:MATE family efflux transporter [Pseudomonas sp. CrR25]